MKLHNRNIFISLLVTTMLLCFFAAASQEAELEDGFAQPPEEARPWVYWFFMDGNLSREGMTADLEAMKAAGIGGMIIMEVDVGVPRGPVAFMSDEWCGLFKHAVEEAERLGLAITLNAGPGWTGSGGPWVKAEQSMQHLVASVTEADGPSVFDAVLPVPEPRKPYFGENTLTPETALMREAFYADEMVLAMPRTDGTLIDDIDEKALYYREPYTSKPGVKPWLPAPAEHPELPTSAVVPVTAVMDLTDRLQPDGRLVWEVPEGVWTILRMGRRTTGANTRPAPQPGLGLESDKFDKAALDAHFEAFVGRLLHAIGPRPADRTTGWTMLHIDSWEMGSQNWTAGFRDTFRQRRGYDPLPYLPAMTGRVIGSVEISERFLWDLRLTAQELVVENHAEHLKALGRQHGFGLSIEPYDMNPTADMVLGGVADVPMCEFWSQGYGFDSAFTCIESASVAHTLGRPVVAAEAFTAAPGEDWRLYPAAMKNQGDWAFCTGINRIVFHRYAHQPWLDRRPGMTMGPYGVHWERTQTWWPMVGDYHRYLARCQFLLRKGRFVADVCYLTPEGAPHVFRPPASALEGDLHDRRGYNFDGCTPDTLLTATVVNGAVVLPSGASYRLLVLPAFDTMTPALLQKIHALVEAGATVVGPPPRTSPSLSGYPACDDEVLSGAIALWGDLQPPAQVMSRTIGKGRVIWGGELMVPGAGTPQPSLIEKAQWIWHTEEALSLPPCKRYFRRAFTCRTDQPVTAARVQATADNDFLLYVNGAMALKGENFGVVYEADVLSLLSSGENMLAARVVNGGDGPNPAGFIATLHLEYADGSSMDIVTDDQWLSSRESDAKWRVTTAAGDNWTNAVPLGAYDMAPWHLKPGSTMTRCLYPDYDATAALLHDMGMPPDFESNGPVRYTHRTTPDGEFYFVANRSAETVATTCLFRVMGRQPELWHPVTGEIRALPEFSEAAGRTGVPLRFEPFESFFLIFRKDAPGQAGQAGTNANFPCFTNVAAIDGAWDVTFDTTSGGPGTVRFETLQDWRDRPEAGIRHYAGIATYRKDVDLPDADGGRLLLDIGEVKGMARVRLNGHDLGVVWCAPWRVDITDAVQTGANRLEIEVANLWPNRLIGDKASDADTPFTWTTYNPYKANAPLLESGLKGPVQVLLEHDFPMVDYHVHLKGGLTLDEAKAWALKQGVRYGIAQNCGVNFPVTDDAGLTAYIETMKSRNVYVGMQAEGREWVELFSPEAIAQFDYVFTDAMTWRNDDGHRMRLWIKDEVVIGEPDAFMDMLVQRTVWILENEPIDIYVNPTYLPAELAGRYDELWTQERLDRIIHAAVNNGVAIEISAGMKLPKPDFIKRAKAAGATFAFGTNNGGNTDLGNLEYCREMIRECGLTPADMFVPKPDGQKAIQRKPLPLRKY